MRTLFVVSICFSATALFAQDPSPGRKSFESRCARCHGGDGNGGDMGPSILGRITRRNDLRLATVIHEGLPNRGMPANPMPDPETAALISFLRSIQRRTDRPVAQLTAVLTSGGTLDGQIMNEGGDDISLRTADGRIHLLRRAGQQFREVTSDKDWPTYNGDPRGNRYTEMSQITPANVGKLASRWAYTLPGAGQLQVSPVVVSGIMYVTLPYECFALDAGSGRQIWHYQRERPSGGVDASVNRGAGVAGDRVFFEAGNARLVALNRFTGELLWDSEIADPQLNYFATSAPLPAGDLVIAGVGGGEHGANGFVAAFDQKTGKEAWRFWSVPKRGEKGSETWTGKEIDHGGAPTWFTGSYDPELDMVYWPTGNPSEEYNGDARPGDNLYSDCVLAIDRKTGKLIWHYQFTPHDLWDWDSTETSIMVNAEWKGSQRQLMLHADRNGFFYVFDRKTGELLLAKQFLRKVTWASGIGKDGRPVKLPNQEPTKEGTLVCPSQDGATNWFSPSFNPQTGLLYFQTFEKCSIYKKAEHEEWQKGKSYLGGSQQTAADPKPVRELKALDIWTGEVKWTIPQPGPAQSWGGTIATATGVVFYGAEGGELVAVNAKDGKKLWDFKTNQLWKASPIAYSFDGKEYIAVAAGPNILTFALRSRASVMETLAIGTILSNCRVARVNE